MDDTSFEELRGALAPDRDRTSRLGALYLLQLSLDDDERIPSLLSTLLRDRNGEISAAAAALVYADPALKSTLSRELTKAWAMGMPEYRSWLVQRLDGESLGEIAMQCASAADVIVKLGLLSRLDEIPEKVQRRDAALFMSQDSALEVRERAMSALADLAEQERAGSPTAPSTPESLAPSIRAASLRLMTDSAPSVRRAAARGIAAACSLEEARELLMKLANESDLDVREVASNLMREVQGRLNLASVEPLVARQAELIAAGEYNKAMAVAAQVFMRVANHGGCQFQMARAAAGLGDVRRSLHLLANAFQAGFADIDAASSDPLLAPARATEAWAEVMSYAPRA